VTSRTDIATEAYGTIPTAAFTSLSPPWCRRSRWPARAGAPARRDRRI